MVDALSTSTDISAMQEGETYYFAVRACPDDRSLCCAFSTEVAGIVPYAQSVIYEDGEDGNTQGWSVYDNSPAGASISNVIEPDSGDRVIAVSGAGLDNGYKLRGEDGQRWGNDTHHVISWDMKYSEDFHVYVDVETSAGQRYLEYTPTTGSDRLGDGQYVHHSLDVGLTDGSWQRVERDLAADLADAQPGVELLQVNGFLIRGSGLLDNIGMH